MRRAMWLVGISSLLAVACAGESAAPLRTDPTVPAPPPRTTTTVAADPYAIPDVIDEAYVNRVLAALDEEVGEVLRLVVRTRSIPPEAVDRLKLIYASPQPLELVLDGYSVALARGLPGIRPDPGNRVTNVSNLITVNRSCIFATVVRDSSALSATEISGVAEQWVVLVPKNIPNDATYDATPWMFAYDGFEQDRSAPVNPCVS